MPSCFRIVAVGFSLTYFTLGVFGQDQQDSFSRRSASGASPTNNLRDLRPKGPSTYIDVTEYGARAISTPPATTGSINRGTNRLTVANGSGFVNGDGIVVRGAGANLTIKIPSAPAVTPSAAAVLTGTGLTVENALGASKYQYQIVARDIGGGYTVASAITPIASGPSTLGSVSVNVSSWTASNTVVTVKTSSAHSLVAGQMVLIAGAGAANGWWQVATVPTGTSFTFNTSSDTRLGAAASGGAEGTVTTWFCNHIRWTPVDHAMAYFIYGRTSGNMALIGISMPQSSTFGITIAGDPLQNSFDDFGATMTANISPTNIPDWVPLTPPIAPKNDDLVTTVASGAGTTTLTLAADASNTVSSATVKFDDAPNIAAAALASTNNKTAALGTLYFPSFAGRSYVINSVMQLSQFPRVLSVKQAGSIVLGDTMILGGTQWTTDNQNTDSKPAFSRMALPHILSSTAYPMIYAPNQVIHFSYVNLQHNSPSGIILVEDQGGAIPAGELDHVQFETAGNDYMAQHLVVRGDSAGAAHYSFRYCTYTAGLSNILGQTATPLFYGDGMGTPVIFNYGFFNRRGAFFRGLPQGVQLTVDFHYEQGGIMPMFSAYGAGSVVGLAASFRNVVEDTMSAPLFSYFGTMQGQINVQGANGTGGGQPLINGPAGTSSGSGILIRTENVGPSGASFSQQGLDHSAGTSNAIDGVIGSNPSSNVYQKKQINLGLGLGNLYQLWIDSARQAAPTCSVSPGGNVPIGRHTFQVAPVFSSGGEGVISALSTSCTTTRGNQTITINWAAIAGAIGYDLYENNRAFQCNAPWVKGGNTNQFIWKSDSPCGASVPKFSGSGPTSVTAAALSSPMLRLENNFTGSLTAESLTANRTWTIPDADGQLVLAPTNQSFAPKHVIVADSKGKLIDSGVKLAFTNQQFLDCGTATTCSQIAQPSFVTVKGGPIALSNGTVTITSLPFTSSTSYVCTPSDSIAANGLSVIYNSGNSVTFKGTGSDTIRYICTGN